ncbi:MAG: hypothetical protein ABIX28_10540 [Vicinamibacterales bacterium]
MSARAVVAIVLVVGLFEARGAGAQPWQPAKGAVAAGLTFQSLRAVELATPAGNVIDIPRFTRDELTVFGNAGVTRRLAIVGAATLLVSTSIEAFERATGVGDARIGIQTLLGQRGAWTAGLRGLVHAPTGNSRRGEGLLPAGSGAWEGEVVLSIGRPIGGRLFVFGEAGHHVRGRGLRDTFVFNSQVGYVASPRLTLEWNTRGVQPYDNGPIGTTLGSAAGLGDGVTFIAFGPSATIRVRRAWAILAGVDGGGHLRNIAAAPAFRVGVAYSR